MRKTGKYLALLMVIIGTFWSLPSGMRAQSGNQAGLIVRFSEQHVETACVEFEEPQISGMDLLQRSGLDFSIDVQGLGAIVCSIEDTGCPANDCWCQCSGGSDCIYWSYWQQREGAWQYSQAGSSISQVNPGSIQGWSWGPGAVSQAIAPPDISFEDVCQLPATDTATASPSLTPSQTSTPIIINVSDTATANSTDPVSTVPNSPTSTPTSQPANNPASTATATANLPATSTPRPVLSATPVRLTEVPPTSPFQPAQVPTITNTSVSEQTGKELLATQRETPEIAPTKTPDTATVTATEKPGAVAAAQSMNPTNVPQEIAELPDEVVDSKVKTSEPLTVVGSSFVPATKVARELKSSEQSTVDFSFADWFPYLVFLIISGGLAFVLLVQSVWRKNKEA